LGALINLVLGVIGSLLAAEVWAHLPKLAELVARLAVKLLPRTKRQRFEEEWLAELGQFPGRIDRMIWASGLFIAASGGAVKNAISRDFLVGGIRGNLTALFIQGLYSFLARAFDRFGVALIFVTPVFIIFEVTILKKQHLGSALEDIIHLPSMRLDHFAVFVVLLVTLVMLIKVWFLEARQALRRILRLRRRR
jgi:hypothetical protein